MPPDLTDDDKAILVELLREVIAGDRFFLSPRIRRSMAVLAKLDPLTPRSEPLPRPKPPGGSDAYCWRRREGADQNGEFAVAPTSAVTTAASPATAAFAERHYAVSFGACGALDVEATARLRSERATTPEPSGTHHGA